MRNVGKHPKCFMLLSFFLVISALLVWSGVGFAIENPVGTTINNTLTGDPNCINYGTIDTNLDYKHGMYVEGKDDEGESHYASNFGNVITHGYGAYGMYAKLGAIATNYSGGMITTHVNDARGMYAESGSTATNNSEGTIITQGSDAYGMYAKIDSTVINSGSIETIGGYARGMYAESGSTATNNSEGTIITHGYGAYGMYALGYYYNGVYYPSTATNSGSITTEGEKAYGMYAYGLDSTVTNNNGGTITTYGSEGLGMYAEDNATAINNGTIETNGYLGYFAHGMYALNNATAINNGSIKTNDYYASGMEAWDIATAINNGSIKTNDYYAFGMRASDNANATNNGSIETNGIRAYGMFADLGAITNNGSIITHGQDAFGMFANAESTATNSSSIETNGIGAHGMYARYGSTTTNDSGGTIITHGEEAYGMYAESYYNSYYNLYYYSTATNSGSIETYGDRARGMFAEYGSTATNESEGTITTYAIGAYGMLAGDESTAINESGGVITTYGDGAFGVLAGYDSTAINNGTIETNGYYASGMFAGDESTAINESDGTITTYGDAAFGIFALYDSTAINNGTIETNGYYAYGMLALYDSTATNESVGTITTYGDEAYGMYARIALPYVGTPVPLSDEGNIDNIDVVVQNHNNSFAAKAINNGTITTYGKEAHGMYISGEYESYPTALQSLDDDISDDASAAINTGTITVTGEGADAVYVENSTFTNSGTLDSFHGNAITSVNSTVTLKDGTKLPNSRNIVGDDGSTLNVDMEKDLTAVVKGFGTFDKKGKGTLTLEGGSSVDSMTNSGTLKIAPNTTFETSSYTQETGASLHVYVPSDPNAGYPLKVSNEGGYAAKFAGNLTIDYSNYLLPGKYNYIYVAGEREGDFDSVSYVNPNKAIYTVYKPQWVKGNSWYYTGLVDYSFSEQALGLVSAIEDWSLLRWIMANHLQDVASEMDNLEAGKKVYYAHFLSSKTDRDPSGGSPLGYESDTRGISFGFDKKTDEKTVWGIYAGYTEKDIDFTDVAPASADWEEQDSWHIGAYMSKRFDKWIISDTLTYRSTDHDSFRRQKDGDARASFDSWAVTNDIRAGYVVKEIGNDSHWEIVPEVGLNVGYFNRDGYSETNGYTYDDYDTTVTEGVIGVRFKGEFVSKDGSRFSPYVRLSYVNVLSGDDVTIDQSWYGNKSWFTEKLDDDYFAADLGMTLYSAGNFDMSLNYNGRFGDDSESHGGWLRLEWKQ